MDFKNKFFSIPPRVSSRIIALLLALTLSFFSFQIAKSIENNGSITPPDQSGQDDTENKAPAISPSVTHFESEGAISIGTVIDGRGAIVCNLTDNKIIAEKAMNSPIQTSDVTSFMIALVVSKEIKEGRISLTDEAVCPAAAATSPTYNLSSQVLPIGKRMQVQNILKCMLYQKGSSYAYTLAVHVGGSLSEFTKKMNEYASEIGLECTFADCIGEAGGNLISPYDFAVIMKYFYSDTLLSGMLCSDDILTVGYGQSGSVELVVRNDFFQSWCTVAPIRPIITKILDNL